MSPSKFWKNLKAFYTDKETMQNFNCCFTQFKFKDFKTVLTQN